MKKYFLYCAMCFLAQQALSQDVSKKEVAKVKYDCIGSIVISGHIHNETSIFSSFLNFGGPAIRLDYGKLGISYGMFPSLRFFNSNAQLLVTPILGSGFQFNYKKVAVALPMYYLASPRTKNNIWIISVGAGYKF